MIGEKVMLGIALITLHSTESVTNEQKPLFLFC